LSAYNVIDLGTLGSGTSWAYDLNNSNQVVGYAATAAGQDHAFLFSDANGNGAADPGEMVDLGVLAGDTASYAYGVSDAGEVVGTSRSVPLGTDGEERAVRFIPGAGPTDLGLGRGSNGYGSSASDVNAASQVVGGALSGEGANYYVPFLRSVSGTVATFTLPAPYNLWGEARAINDAGSVVGYSGGPLGDSGFIRSASGVMTPVGHDNPALPYNYAWDLNDAGQVVGEGFNSAGDYRGFLWQDGAVTDLGTLPGMGSSEAFGVNNAGAVVGRAEQPDGTAGSTRAFLYRDGAMRDLNDLIPADAGWFIAEARAINDHGAIAAVGFSPAGAIHAALLVPNGTVAGRHVFYNHSAFDGHDAAPGAADDAAIAPDKQPLLGAGAGAGAATLANVTNYSRGINGVMIDLAGAGGTPGEDDYDFRVGTEGSPEAWSPAPRPVSVTVRPGAGAGGSDRVTVIWEDGTIRNQWLQVTVRPSATTGLGSPDVFYVGNVVGEAMAPFPKGPFAVDARDLVATRLHMRAAPVAITEMADFNRDRRVDARDLAIVRANNGTTLATPTGETIAITSDASVAASPSFRFVKRRLVLTDLLS
jgi:probable HAF family extracellular repeat protein